MKGRKRVDMRKHFISIALAALTVAGSLVLTGCRKQIARAEERQLRLQTLSQTDAEQIARRLARLEEDLRKLHVVLADLQAGTNRGATNTAAPQAMKLQEILPQNSQQLSDNIATVGQNPGRLQGQIELIQSDIQKVASAEGAEPRLQTQRWKRQPDGGWQLQKASKE